MTENPWPIVTVDVPATLAPPLRTKLVWVILMEAGHGDLRVEQDEAIDELGLTVRRACDGSALYSCARDAGEVADRFVKAHPDLMIVQVARVAWPVGDT